MSCCSRLSMLVSRSEHVHGWFVCCGVTWWVCSSREWYWRDGVFCGVSGSCSLSQGPGLSGPCPSLDKLCPRRVNREIRKQLVVWKSVLFVLRRYFLFCQRRLDIEEWIYFFLIYFLFTDKCERSGVKLLKNATVGFNQYLTIWRQLISRQFNTRQQVGQ